MGYVNFLFCCYPLVEKDCKYFLVQFVGLLSQVVQNLEMKVTIVFKVINFFLLLSQIKFFTLAFRRKNTIFSNLSLSFAQRLGIIRKFLVH